LLRRRLRISVTATVIIVIIIIIIVNAWLDWLLLLIIPVTNCHNVIMSDRQTDGRKDTARQRRSLVRMPHALPDTDTDTEFYFALAAGGWMAE